MVFQTDIAVFSVARIVHSKAKSEDNGYPLSRALTQLWDILARPSGWLTSTHDVVMLLGKGMPFPAKPA